MIGYGREFYKLSGSGNDFIFVDAMESPPGHLADAKVIARLCARRTGIGADGIVFLTRSAGADFRMTYYNSDGSEAAMCGNAALCAARLASELGFGGPQDFQFETGSGIIAATVEGDRPEILLPAVSELAVEVIGLGLVKGETRVGFARVGVPHLVVECEDVQTVDLMERGRALRWDSAIPDGANVNFLSGKAGEWSVRTYERGVEGETMACGTGTVACMALLNAWGHTGHSGSFRAASGCDLIVTMDGDRPKLRGEGRIVYRGNLGES
ncbi:MAG: diaminopimelate epimerase [Anaerolineae bacterium]|nr:diaminopimelate epimerase [Gemmatimonadaceae bacterium]